jgi:WD40 repeat protein
LLVFSDAHISVFETATGKLLGSVQGDGLMSHTVALAADDKTMLTGTWDLYIRGDFTARLWDLTTGKQVRVVKESESVKAVALSEDAQWLFTATGGKVRLWNARTEKEVASWPAFVYDNKSCVVSRDCTTVVTANDKAVLVSDLKSGKRTYHLSGHEQMVTVLALSKDGKRLVTAGFDRSVRAWDLTNGKPLGVVKDLADAVDAIALSNDGKWMALGDRNGLVQLREVETGKVLRSFQTRQQGGNRAFALSPDNKTLAAGGYSEGVSLCDVQAGKETAYLVGHTGPVMGLAFLRDGQRLVSTSCDQTSRFWDVASGKELCRTVSFRDGTWAVLDPSGRYDAANDGDVPGLHWVVGTEVVPLRQYCDRAYDPGLLSKHLGFSREPLRKAPFE